jgi:hypothetical protein
MTEKDQGQTGDLDERIDSLPRRVNHTALTSLAAAFKESVDRVDFLAITPHILISHGYGEAASFNFFSQLAETKDITGVSGFDDWFERVRSRVEAVAAQPEAQEKWRKHLWETANRHLASLLSDKKATEALRSLKLARLVLGWTAFECLSRDAWEAALNESPAGLAQQTVRGLPSEEDSESGLTRKQVPVAFLSKFGFDLRKRMGTVLRSKFDFTSVSGMRQAYIAAFGDKKELSSIFAEPELMQLEAFRNLIVHRGGIVDEEYLKRSGATHEIGQPLSPDDEVITATLNAMKSSGCELLLFVDQTLTSLVTKGD